MLNQLLKKKELEIGTMQSPKLAGLSIILAKLAMK